MRSVVILFVTLASATAKDMVDMKKIAARADAVLLHSVVPGQMIRQCSCQEQGVCVEEMKAQLKECSSECNHVFKKITDSPEKLMSCVHEVSPKIHSFISCAQDNIRACVSDKDGPMMPYHDMNKMFELGEKDLLSRREEILNHEILSRMRPLTENVLDFAGCVKNCFVKKNADGYCYDRQKCQSLITTDHLVHTLKECSRGLNWKAEAGGICHCALISGVRGLDDVCPLLMVMG